MASSIGVTVFPDSAAKPNHALPRPNHAAGQLGSRGEIVGKLNHWAPEATGAGHLPSGRDDLQFQFRGEQAAFRFSPAGDGIQHFVEPVADLVVTGFLGLQAVFVEEPIHGRLGQSFVAERLCHDSQRGGGIRGIQRGLQPGVVGGGDG